MPPRLATQVNGSAHFHPKFAGRPATAEEVSRDRQTRCKLALRHLFESQPSTFSFLSNPWLPQSIRENLPARHNSKLASSRNSLQTPTPQAGHGAGQNRSQAYTPGAQTEELQRPVNPELKQHMKYEKVVPNLPHTPDQSTWQPCLADLTSPKLCPPDSHVNPPRAVETPGVRRTGPNSFKLCGK